MKEIKIKRYLVIAELEGGACHQVLIKENQLSYLDSLFAQMFPNGVPLLSDALTGLVVQEAEERETEDGN